MEAPTFPLTAGQVIPGLAVTYRDADNARRHGSVTELTGTPSFQFAKITWADGTTSSVSVAMLVRQHGINRGLGATGGWMATALAPTPDRVGGP